MHYLKINSINITYICELKKCKSFNRTIFLEKNKPVKLKWLVQEAEIFFLKEDIRKSLSGDKRSIFSLKCMTHFRFNVE